MTENDPRPAVPQWNRDYWPASGLDGREIAAGVIVLYTMSKFPLAPGEFPDHTVLVDVPRVKIGGAYIEPKSDMRIGVALYCSLQRRDGTFPPMPLDPLVVETLNKFAVPQVATEQGIFIAMDAVVDYQYQAWETDLEYAAKASTLYGMDDILEVVPYGV